MVKKGLVVGIIMIFICASFASSISGYLEEINPSISAERNIERLCFMKEGYLFNEFDNIFSDLFSRRKGIYKKIIMSLISQSQSLNEIIKIIIKEKSGTISKYLEDLESDSN